MKLHIFIILTLFYVVLFFAIALFSYQPIETFLILAFCLGIPSNMLVVKLDEYLRS